jgi:hypothetical protein
VDFKDPKVVTVWLTRAIAYVAYAYFVLTEIILVQGFLLKLFGADPSSDYTQWAYRSLDRVMAPFRGIFTPIELDGNAILDPSIIFAMVIYGILALVLRSFLDWVNVRLEKLQLQHLVEEEQAAALAAGVYQVPPAMAVQPRPGQPAQPAQSTQPGQHAQPGQPAQPTQSTQPAQHAQPAQPAPPAQPTGQPAPTGPPPGQSPPPNPPATPKH